MGGGPNANDPAVVSAFHRDLLHGGLVVLGLLVALFVVWRACRARQLRIGDQGGADGAPSPAPTVATPPEAPARRLLRIGFGLLWVFAGLLQGQASMPLGLIPQVIQPAARTSP